MAKLVWDQSGEKIFETGLDRGVLYLDGESGVAWNGLISLIETDPNESEPYFFDGFNTGNFPVASDFVGKLSAFTYPEEFSSCLGVSISEYTPGLQIPNQHTKGFFGLSYRTFVGDDIDNTDLGYKIHILYNLTVVADGIDYETLSDDIDPIEFSWMISSVPEIISGYNATAHVIADSRYLSNVRLTNLENILYGTESTSPRLPRLGSLLDALEHSYILTITDNGDGTWTADGLDNMVYMDDSTTFVIDGGDVVYLDDDTYTITSS